MVGLTKIEWAHFSWNPTTGCTKVSPGCDHCYAETLYERFHGKGSFGKITLHWERLNEPHKWQKAAIKENLPERKRVFVNSMSDLGHKAIPYEFLDKCFATMALCGGLDFLILTKRPDRLEFYMKSDPLPRIEALTGRKFIWPLGNIWIGTSLESQKFISRLDTLARIPAVIRFVSAEPLLGPLDLRHYLAKETYVLNPADRAVDWVIVGGESGPHARPCNMDSIRDIKDQCVATGTPLFIKQLGRWPARRMETGGYVDWFAQLKDSNRVEYWERNSQNTGWIKFTDFYQRMPVMGSIEVGRLKDAKGGDMTEWPEDLRIREVPNVH